jgi:purine-cytosine permease-like protein
MTILNIYAEFSHSVYVESFSITIFIAIFLQLFIVLTRHAEHKLSNFFGDRKNYLTKIKYFLSLWALLFFSKFLMLHGANLIFGDKINFYGMFDGLLAFIVVILSFLLGEYLLTKIYRALESK